MIVQFLVDDQDRGRIRREGNLLSGGTAGFTGCSLEAEDPRDIVKKLSGGGVLMLWEWTAHQVLS